MRSCRKQLFASLTAAAMASAAHAAEVTVEWIAEDGSRATLVGGSLDYPIVHIVSPRGIDSDAYFIDACGDVMALEEDMLGERSFGKPLEPRHEVRDVMAFFTGSQDGILFGNDGRFHELDVSERSRRLMGPENFHFRSGPIESGLPLERIEAIWVRRAGGHYFARLDDGNLMLIKSFAAGDEHARLLAPKKGWGDVVDVVAGEYMHQKGGMSSDVFVTLHDDGRLVRHFYGENPSTNNYDIESHELPGDFSDIRRMLHVSGTQASYGVAFSNRVMAWTADGSFVNIDIDTGKREHIGEAGSFKGERVVALRNRYGAYLISANGAYKECPVVKEAAPEPVIVPEASDDKGVFEMDDQMAEIYERNKTFFETIEDWPPFYDNSATGEEIVSHFKEAVEMIKSFQAKDEPKIKHALDRIDNDFGGELALSNFMRKVSDGKRNELKFASRNLLWYYRTYTEDSIPAIKKTLKDQAERLILDAEYKERKGDAAAKAAYESAAMVADLAHVLDPGHPDGKAVLAKSGAKLAAADQAEAERLAKELEDTRWPGRDKTFAGPGDPGELEAIAFEFVGRKSGGGLLALAVADDWYVYKKTVTGLPISWCLPINVAMQNDEHKDHAWLSYGAVCTVGGQPRPPFNHYVALGDVKLMQKKFLP